MTFVPWENIFDLEHYNVAGPYSGNSVSFTKLPGTQGVLVEGVCTDDQCYVIFSVPGGFKNKMIEGHKYLVVKNILGTRDPVKFMDTYSTRFNTTSFQIITYHAPGSGSVDAGLLLYRGDTANHVIVRPMVFDLTKMYGAGNEPTEEECQAIFGMPYYPYHKLS